MPVRSAPYRKLHSVPAGSVRFTRGFWAERFEVCRLNMVPNMWRLLRDPDISHAYTNFQIAAGLETGVHKGPKWHDGDFYKWLEAAAHITSITRDDSLEALMDEVIQTIQASQRADGYIHTPTVIAERMGGEAKTFQDRLHFETYNMGHLMTAACAHYQATGKRSLLAVAAGAADYLDRYYREAKLELARNAICPSHYMGVVDLYHQTGDARYLDLACNLFEIRDLVQDGGDDNQDRLPFRQQMQAAGHAVRANYLYAGAADIYMETGDASLLATLERLWRNVVSAKMYVTGGCGALYDGASPDGAIEQSSITRVHQAYGRAYQLPNVTAHNETCANIGNLLWNWRMLALSGEVRYADIVELVLYNSALSAISLDGLRFFYTNPLRQVGDLPFELRWGRQRESYIECFCCPPNIVRMVAQAGSFLYSLGEDGVYVHLYAGSTADLPLPGGIQLRLKQETNYPWDGEVLLILEPESSRRFTLRLRIPGWCPGGRVSVNDEMVTGTVLPGSYLCLDRKWQAGDEVKLSLDMPVQYLESHPLVEETYNQLAVRRGPLIYCLESRDLPEAARIESIRIARNTDLQVNSTSTFDGLIRDIRVLTGELYILDQGSWDDQLYRTARQVKPQRIETQLIPYFAWDNRGKSEMSVWIPEIMTG